MNDHRITTPVRASTSPHDGVHKNVVTPSHSDVCSAGNGKNESALEALKRSIRQKMNQASYTQSTSHRPYVPDVTAKRPSNNHGAKYKNSYDQQRQRQQDTIKKMYGAKAAARSIQRESVSPTAPQMSSDNIIKMVQARLAQKAQKGGLNPPKQKSLPRRRCKQNANEYIPGALADFWECQRCNSIPYRYRCAESVVFYHSNNGKGPNSDNSKAARRHFKICRGARRLKRPRGGDSDSDSDTD
mmetsp:Transcript_46378/g.68472  ORF Transcript_46378/g.68472 Transcript_46378/m.68472 type:complete len:243 (-) Transcript_46378:77-805(-)|eukprot:CAMPEP_0195530896 /NCGR_PEP_ID=MMETSP0794_2-20130614/34013_1 /TAXON_ID=515487 /ORGANISM="Stephanopyxis turris, Strain CCMP 815" /LENGTH=242 /DNA_ID=CAMNT_0040662517 /DNA_START=31 /DNA_END=759 /DNA_ORIENTATION=+